MKMEARVGVRVGDAELAMLDELARHEGRGRSAVLRRLIAREHANVFPGKENPDAQAI
ncbi:MAG: ribbon-helix-helix domain-containing protein [Phycicoccus sp.]